MGLWMMPLRWGRSSLVTLACVGMTLSPTLQPAFAQQPVANGQRVPIGAPRVGAPSVAAPAALQAAPIQTQRSVGKPLSKDIAMMRRPIALDVTLGATGTLTGEVRNAEGKTSANMDVVLWQGNRMLQRTRTNGLGQFQFINLQGGSYRIATPDVTLECRAWTAQLAPPNARESLLVVANMYSARGQQPINEVFCFNPFLMGTIVAAAIAIPIAVHDSGDGQLGDGELVDGS